MKGDQLYTDDCFDKFFNIGEPVVVGTKRSIKVQLNHDDENLSCDLRGPKEIEVFASLEKSPLNTTDIACHSCGIIYVPLPVGGWPEHVKGRIGIEVTGVDNFRITYIDDEDISISCLPIKTVHGIRRFKIPQVKGPPHILKKLLHTTLNFYILSDMEF